MRAAPSGALATLKHRTCSATPFGACWEFDVRRGIHKPQPTIIARVVLGASKPFDVEIPVCASRWPIPGAWTIHDLGGGAWRVACARYGLAFPLDTTRPAPFVEDEDWPIGSLDLVGAPDDVDAELRRLADAPVQ